MRTGSAVSIPLLLIGVACGSAEPREPMPSGALPSDAGNAQPQDDVSANATGTGAWGYDSEYPGVGVASPEPRRAFESVFETVSAGPTECTLSARACRQHWPDPVHGRVERFESLERFGATEHTREFTLYVPERVDGPVPVVIVLHGGQPIINEPGASLFADRFDELADGREIRWARNSEGCALDTSTQPEQYRDPTGTTCEPETAIRQNEQPFLVVYPDGLIDVDGAGRHWEDGRVPSPGSDAVQQRRDDVGFLNHVIDRLLEERADIVDPERLYLLGYSNGGFMTTRVACETRESDAPIDRIAAYATVIATMAEALIDGTDGRPVCAPAGREHGIAFFLGKDIDTPNCEFYGCTEPLESGDGRVIFGEPGGVYTVNSPDGGRTWNAPDTVALFVSARADRTGCGFEERSEDIGQFTRRTRYRFFAGESAVELYETSGGVHGGNVGRSDYLLSAEVVDFLFSFRRTGEGLKRTAAD